MRNDFLLHCEAEDSVLRAALPKQVEINTFGPDFGARSPVVQKLQIAFILIVREDREENLYDQLFIEYAIEAAHPKAPVIRRRMSDLRGSSLCNGKLFV
ncbi:hypothetical protein HPB49_001140 [Dermacentor silvarum]|uniref:Uncharacterized protein n=1 Tax=Dermacentor silvarum TaxID=543639 RepID=A0ACB8D9K9_DERSI|nr:hypothetical protein HPB49_001140 [Dermacentor silvarum]